MLIQLAVIVALAVLASPVGVVWLARRLGRVERELAETRRLLAETAGRLAAGAPADAATPAALAADAVPDDFAGPDAAAEAAPPVPAAAGRGLEEAVTSRFMVWVGGIAVALSAVFLFRFAVEEGWLGPWTRVGLGLGLGAALIAAGTWAERAPARLARAVRPDAAGPALTAAGVFALFVSLYAAHALYGLIGAPVAFAALGAVSFAALGLARRQGWFVALVGLAAGYLIPALLESATRSAAPVFVFLFALTAGCLALMTVRRWWFLAAAVLIGALGWPLLWLAQAWSPVDQGVLGSYAVGVAALFGVFGTDLPVRRPEDPARAWLVGLVSHTSGLGFLLAGALLVGLAGVYGFNAPAALFLGLYAAAGLALGLRHPAFEVLALAAALVVAAAVLLWPMPAAVTSHEEMVGFGVERAMTGFGPFLLPPELRVFARSLLGFAALFGLGGFAARHRAPTPALWAAISAAVPLFLLAVGYWRIGGFEVDLGWAGLAVGLAVANLAAAARVARTAPPPRRDAPVAFYAAASTAALALAFACLLREAWLTVALALEVLALAWIWTRLRVPALRIIAFALVGAVIVRLALNPALLAYGGFGWVLYGYGLPAAAFLAAARLWRSEARDPLADLCEIAAAGFLLIMVALQLRLWTAGAIAAPNYHLVDMAAQTLWWLVAAAVLLRADLAPRLPWARFAGTGLLLLAASQLVLGHLLVANPLWNPGPVGRLPLLNLLGAAYLAPAALLGGIGATRASALDPRIRPAVAALAGLLAFAWVTLEVRRAFWPGGLMLGPETRPVPAEIYAYTAAWIAFALALLGVGILRRSRPWRALALAVLVAAVLKAFLYDMSDLTGLLRVASFLGLGLALIGIGQIYRRFVFTA